ncbi:50S ribosomal protein L10 [bacterium]|nr:50S ribosomal protein L10 [bacterium]MBU1025666.1 50S ribosomal protein L10 [bacterium]
MPTPEKEKKVEIFAENLQKSRIAFIAEYQGLTVEQVSRLRKNLRDTGSEMKIIKNTLAKRALSKAGLDDLASHLEGPIAFFLGYETAVNAPKTAFAFAKENDKLKIKNGYYAGRLVDFNLLKELANLPPLDSLRVTFAATISFPPKKFLNMVMAPLTQFVLTLNALADKLEEKAN